MKLSNITKFIASQPERIVFGICAILLLIVLAAYLTGGKEDEAVSVIMNEKMQLDEVIKMNVPAVLGPIEYIKKIRSIWEDIQQPVEGKSWLMYRPPVIPVKFEKIAIITPDKKTNLPPIANGAKANSEKPDEILLAWAGNISSTAQIKSYKLYRKAQGEKDFAVIAEIPAVTPTGRGYTYMDKGLKPETEYSYCFTALSDEQSVIKNESDRSEGLKATTIKDYSIEFISVIKEKNSVYVKIGKYLNGKWEYKSPFISKGDKIDKDEYITGWTFVDFQPDVYPKSTGSGVVNKPTFRIIYLDRNGKEGSYLIEPK